MFLIAAMCEDGCTVGDGIAILAFCAAGAAVCLGFFWLMK